jgi:hypothetical protein
VIGGLERVFVLLLEITLELKFGSVFGLVDEDFRHQRIIIIFLVFVVGVNDLD